MSNLTAVTVNGESKDTNLILSNPKDFDSKLESLKKANAGMDIAPKYLEFEKVGEKSRGIFVRYTQIEVTDQQSGEVKALTAIVWVDVDKNLYINAGTHLVSTFTSQGIQPATPIEIEYTEKKKTGRGNMKVYSVRLLSID